jgi:hypothetical protein
MSVRNTGIRLLLSSLLTAVLLSGTLATGTVAQDQPEGCPASLGPLDLQSETTTESERRFGKVSCFYRSKDWEKQVTIRAAWVSADHPDATLDLAATYCLAVDEEQVADRQYGEDTRLGRVFPTEARSFVLGAYLATSVGPSTRKIMDATRVLAQSYAPLAAACPTPAVVPSAEPSDDTPEAEADQPVSAEPEATSTAAGDDAIASAVLDILESADLSETPAFDRAYLSDCLTRDDWAIDILEADVERRQTVMLACRIQPFLGNLSRETNQLVMAVIIALVDVAVAEQS